MELPNHLPPPPVSPLSETTTRDTTTKTRTSGKSKSYISCRTSTGIPRNSYLTISSQSITVFADVKDLPSRSGSPHSKTEEPNVQFKVDTLDLEFKRQSNESFDSISSFGFDVAIPDQAHGAGLARVEDYISQRKLTRGCLPRQTSFRSVWRSKNTSKKQHNLYESFPRPLSKAMLHFATVFPEIVQDKQHIHVDKSLPPPPYHAFDAKKKKWIMYLMATVGVLTPLSTFIYFPALGNISRAFHLNAEFVLLTIAVHMAVQGIASLVWMPLGEYVGRRLALIATLAVFVGANAGLLFSNNFLSLMLLRAAQAFGSADLLLLGGAVIGDISTGEERGALISLYGSILMFGHVISPVLGGVLTQFFGFRSIFWFQLALGSLALILVTLFLPETLRNIAGNGTIRLKPYQQPLIAAIKSSPDARFDSDPNTIALTLTFKLFVEPLCLLSRMKLLGPIIFGAFAFATAVVVIATTALCLETYYSLSTILIGAAFLPSGAGTLLGFFTISFLLQRDYKITESSYRKEYNITDDSIPSLKHNSDFPIERARLRNIWWITLLFTGATIGYGFSLSGKHIAIPLVMQFLVGFAATAILLANGVLISDLCPENLASVTAVINLVRYFTGALAVGVVQLLFWRVDTRFAFLIFAIATLVVTPILVVQWIFGVEWRIKERQNSEDRSFLEQLRGLCETSLFAQLPKWSEIWGKVKTGVLEVGTRINNAFLAVKNFWTKVPGWNDIWRRPSWKPGSDRDLQPTSFIP